MLAIMAIVLCFILVPLFLLQTQIGLYFVDDQRIESVVEGACLVAANDLSKLIIKDPHFGYVSLSNYPPIGMATVAPDGEALPVVGINTLVATVRQNAIVAHELNNATMKMMAEKDRLYLKATRNKLNRALELSMRRKKKETWTDIHNKKIDPLESATKFLKKHLPKHTELKKIRLSTGWLDQEGGTTNMSHPQPERLAYVKEDQVQGGEYKPFIDIPFAGKSYTFAGLSKSSRLVAKERFKKRDQKHINSIIKLECVIARKESQPGGLKLNQAKKYVICCQPYANPDKGPKGVMTLRLTGAPVAGLRSWTDFLNDRTFSDNKVTTYRSIKGDYPIDKKARMLRTKKLARLGTAGHFGQHFYCWLRNGNTRPSIGSVLEVANEYLKLSPNEIYVYEFCKNGNISRRTLPKYPFHFGVTSDKQVSVVADTRIQGGLSPVIIIRNNVRYLGTVYGGKHGGQPLTGNPINWCELHEYGGDEMIAKSLGKGRLGTGLNLSNPIALLSQKKLQPRSNYYSGGLALDIEIGGTNPPNIKHDLLSMRKLKR